ncbi:Up-regulated during septation-domain-containing protein [Kalaharituber pfeilii]|nr:Up-regulated during septation-domain-containing protein [Kalaharituber pfeilii]
MSGSPKSHYPSANEPDKRAPGSRYMSPAPSTYPPTQMLEKHFAVSPTEAEHPRFNPLNKGRPRSSSLLNINDTVAMHLLVETAIIDSAEYEILSFEEVEELKKEYKFLSGRIDAAKRKLALESKVRDAALSLSRLYNNKKGKRRSLLGGNEMTQKTDEELIQSNQKVEQLVQELWGLNNRAVEIQRRLLQHGAGILGMTHQGGSGMKGKGTQQSAVVNHPNGNGDDFDDRSFYRSSDNLDSFAVNGTYTNGHRRGASMNQMRYPNNRLSMIPPESNVTPQFDPYVERRLEQLNHELRQYLINTTGIEDIAEVPQAIGDASGLNEQVTMLEQGIQFIQQLPVPHHTVNPASEHMEQTITTLWDMLILGNEENRVRRASVANGNSSSLGGDDDDDDDDDDDTDAYGTAFSIDAFSYKVQSLYTKAAKLREERNSLRKQINGQKQISSEEREAFQQRLQSREEELGMEVMKLENEIDELNETISARDKELTSTNQELDTLTDEIKQIQEELRDKADELNQAHQDLKAAQEEVALLRQQVQEWEEDADQNHKFSAEVEGERAARLAAETQLTEKLAVEAALLEKIREKESELKEKESSEDALRAKLREQETALASINQTEAQWEKQLQDKEDQLVDLQNRYEEIKEDRNICNAELESAKIQLEAMVADTGARFKALEAELDQLNKRRATADQEKTMAEQQIETLKRDIQEKEQQIGKLDNENRELVEKVAQLSTDVAILKEELDQAYGTKKQRAAETAEAARAAAMREAGKPQAIDPTFLQELDNLANENKRLLEEIAMLKSEREAALKVSGNSQNLEKRNHLLQAELNGMLQDFESLTKQSIEFENERTQLEGVIDKLREKIEALETCLADEKVRMLGTRSMSAGSNGDYPTPSGGESMSTQVLRTEFKKMMRDMRSEHLKALRAEQEDRRKLEAMIRKMKQEQIQQRRMGPTSP